MYYDFKTTGSESGKAYYLGEFTSGDPIDVASKYPKFSALTIDNFAIVPITKYASTQQGNAQTISATSGWTLYHTDINNATYTAPSVTYNSSTGQLSFSASLSVGGQAYNSQNGGGTAAHTYPATTQPLTAKVYLLPKVEDIS